MDILNENESNSYYLKDELEADVLYNAEVLYKVKRLEDEYRKLQLEEDEYWNQFWTELELEELEENS